MQGCIYIGESNLIFPPCHFFQLDLFPKFLGTGAKRQRQGGGGCMGDLPHEFFILILSKIGTFSEPIF